MQNFAHFFISLQYGRTICLFHSNGTLPGAITILLYLLFF